MFSPTFASNYTIDDINSIFNKKEYTYPVTQEDKDFFKRIYDIVMCIDPLPKNFYEVITRKLNFKYTKPHLIKIYRQLCKSRDIIPSKDFERAMVKKATRGHSGVNVVTIFTSGTQFGNGDENSIKNGGCPKNCHYCPFEKDAGGMPTQPRSYLSTEPGNMRATQNKHHPIGQMFCRLDTLEQMGHLNPFYENNSSKLEMIISGGTFNFYPQEYIEWFVTCMYFAANVYFEYKETGKFSRDISTYQEEQMINEISSLRIIGLTIETRPDYLDPRKFEKNCDDQFKVIRFFRKLGVTRVQIGLQHTNDDVLEYVNRDCTDEDNRAAIYFLKQNGFKVDGHWMLDLPMPSHLNPIEEDTKMIKNVLSDPAYELDQWKIYPTAVTFDVNNTIPHSKISEWYRDGEYKPYAEIDDGKYLEEIIFQAMKMMKPWIRVNRIIRDFPEESIEGGVSCPNMRNNIDLRMKKEGVECKCIRTREVKLQKVNYDTVVLKVRHYEASNGDEYFISFETDDEKILIGYLRLRLNRTNDSTMPELHNTAFIRELHVLGKHTELNKGTQGAQHRGYGRRLIEEAEKIAQQEGFNRIAIISGVGVREYYRKFEYKLESTYMVKEFTEKKKQEVQEVDQDKFELIILVFGNLLLLIASNFKFNQQGFDLNSFVSELVFIMCAYIVTFYTGIHQIYFMSFVIFFPLIILIIYSFLLMFLIIIRFYAGILPVYFLNFIMLIGIIIKLVKFIF
jgi:ELP3 family radical SAM enzyme/protein acetyltransferase